MTRPSAFTVLCCRPDPLHAASTSVSRDGGNQETITAPRSAEIPGEPTMDADIARIVEAARSSPVHFVGRRPGKTIDPLLTGRVLVVGDDSDLASVVLRLLRRDLLGSVEVAFAYPGRRSPFGQLWDLPSGASAVKLASHGEVDLVPLVRDDVGGVLVGVGYLGPVNGTVYVDEHRVLRGPARRLQVVPHREKGLEVTVTTRRGFAGFGGRPRITNGRAVQIGTVPTTVVRDGVPYARPMDRWTFYKHTEPLRLVRGLV